MPCTIIRTRYRKKAKDYEATIVSCDDAGKEVGRIVAGASSIEKLKKILAPAEPTNLSLIDELHDLATPGND